jgi:hypothetical protein
MLLRRGEPDDAEKAQSLLDSARTAYRELGITTAAAPASATAL